MTTSRQSPGTGARRSRRGYYYEDLYTLRSCLQMVRGNWDSVLPEGEENVSCFYSFLSETVQGAQNSPFSTTLFNMESLSQSWQKHWTC